MAAVVRVAPRNDHLWSGGCMLFFGLPMLVGGGLAIFAGADWLSGSTAAGAIVIVLGGLLALGGWRTLKRGATSRVKGEVDPRVFNPLESPWFPKRASTCKNLPGGAVLLNVPHSVGMQIGCILVFAAIWGAFSVPVFIAALGKRSQTGDFVPLLISGFFVGILVLILAGAGYLFMRKMAVGRVSIELEHEPVHPGDRVAFRVIVTGAYPVDSGTVTLVCQERVEYRQGTDTRTEHHEAFAQTIAQTGRTAARPGQAIMSGIMAIPANAAVSFTASNNHIEWSLLVAMDIPGLPNVKDSYPFRVGPRLGGENG
jgi:hypothetical protein